MSRVRDIIVVFLVGLLISVSVDADMIDFESGFKRLDPVDSVSTPTNTVSFSTVGLDNSPTFIAQVGTTPKNGFEKKVNGAVQGDTPEGGNPGQFFLTDGAGNNNNYLFDLARPVGEFRLDLYDYVGDGGARPTDFAVLRAFSDSDRTNEVASQMFVVPRPRPADGLAVTLSVKAESIAALTLAFSTFDRGTGIDNIHFITLPEPSSMMLAALAFVAMAASHRPRRSPS